MIACATELTRAWPLTKSYLDRRPDGGKGDALKHLQAGTATELDVLLPSILDKAFKGELSLSSN